MRKNNLFLIVISLLLISCVHQDQPDSLKLTDTLAGLWEDEDAPEFFIEFLPGHEYRIVHANTGVPISYNRFNIFHTGGDGLFFAIVRHVQNKHHFDGKELLSNPDQVQTMTEEEIKHTNADYFYVLFDLSHEMYYYDCNIDNGCFRVFYNICNKHLEKQKITLSEADFTLPADRHWDRVQPGNGCKYSRYATADSRPEFDSQTPYSGPWGEGKLLPWEARAAIRAQKK